MIPSKRLGYLRKVFVCLILTIFFVLHVGFYNIWADDEWIISKEILKQAESDIFNNLYNTPSKTTNTNDTETNNNIIETNANNKIIRTYNKNNKKEKEYTYINVLDNQQIHINIRFYKEDGNVDWLKSSDENYDENNNNITIKVYKEDGTVDWLKSSDENYDEKNNVITYKTYKEDGTVDWANSNTFSQTYDKNKNIIEQKAYKEDGTVNWANSSITWSKTYDKNNNNITKKVYKEDGNVDWANSKTFFQTYDENKNIIEQKIYKEDGTVDWANSNTFSRTYDKNKNIIEQKVYKEDGNVDWANNSRTGSKTYDENKNIIEQRVYKEDETVDWANSNTFSRTYDENKNIIEQEVYKEDGNVDWANNSMTWSKTYDENNNNITSKVYKKDRTVDWANNSKTYSQTYDKNKNVIEQKVYKENGTVYWAHPNTFSQTYDEKNNVITYKTYKEDGNVNYEKSYNIIYNNDCTKKIKIKIKMPLSEIFNTNNKVFIKRDEVANTNKLIRALEKSLEVYNLDLGKIYGTFLSTNNQIQLTASENNLKYEGQANVLQSDPLPPLPFLNNIKGYDDVKQELKHIADYINDYERYKNLGAQVPKGFIFHGPPGTGKTYLAQQLSKELEIPFINKVGTEFQSSSPGKGEEIVRALFNEVRQKNSICIIFIDEIDALCGKRGSLEGDKGGAKAGYQSLLNQFLTELDGFQESNHPIIVIGATNKLELLDEAVLRAGRLEKQILIDLPVKKDCELILEMYLNKIKLNSSLKSQETVKADFLKKLSHECYESKFSGADFKRLTNEAALLAVSKQKDFIDKEELEQALEKIQKEKQTKIAKARDLSSNVFDIIEKLILYSGIILLIVLGFFLAYFSYHKYQKKQKNKIFEGIKT